MMSDAIRKPAGITPSQTVGPYFKYGLTPDGAYPWTDGVPRSASTPDSGGEQIVISGQVTDGDGAPIPDCMLEIWQADAKGRYAHPRDGGPSNSTFRGFARVDTDQNGTYSLTTIKPGKVGHADNAAQAPHILVCVFARGMLRHLYTRIYFADEADANASDPVLAMVPADRQQTLVAERTGTSAYRFSIRIQGDKETVFFAV